MFSSTLAVTRESHMSLALPYLEVGVTYDVFEIIKRMKMLIVRKKSNLSWVPVMDGSHSGQSLNVDLSETRVTQPMTDSISSSTFFFEFFMSGLFHF